MKPLDEKRVEEILGETRRDASPAQLAAFPARVRRAAQAEGARRPLGAWAWIAPASALAGGLAVALLVSQNGVPLAPMAGTDGENAPIAVKEPAPNADAGADPVVEDLRVLYSAADALAVTGPDAEGADLDPTIFDLNREELAQLERLLAQGG